MVLRLSAGTEELLITDSFCLCLMYTNWLTQVICRSLCMMCVFHCRKEILRLLCDGQSMSRPISICVFQVFRAYEQHNYTTYLCLSISLNLFGHFWCQTLPKIVHLRRKKTPEITPKIFITRSNETEVWN